MNRRQLVGVALLCLCGAYPLGFYLGEVAYGSLLDLVAPPPSRAEPVVTSAADPVKAAATFSMLLGALCLICMAILWAVRGYPVHPVARTVLLLGPTLVAMGLVTVATRLLVSWFISQGAPIEGPGHRLNVTSLHLESVPLVGIIVLLLSWRSVRARSNRRKAAARAAAPA